MYIQGEFWLAACALLPTAAAFYPYEPHYGKDTSSNRRAAILSIPSRHAPAAKDTRRSLTLPIRRVPVSSRQNKYNILNSKDPKQENSVAIDQDGTDLSYMVALTIGSSKEEYHLLMDSAASNTWVMGQDCATDACSRHNTFGKGDSDTLKTSSTPFSITYGTGSVSGTTATDTVHIGPLSTSLTFGLANNVSSEFSAYPMDGILGLGRGTAVPGSVEAPTLLDALVAAKLIPKKLYAVHLSRARDNSADGELNLGDVNKDRFSGDINWLDTLDNERGFWEVPISDAGADGTKLGLTGRSAIIDTGTSFILMPESDAVALHKLVPGSSQSGETFSVPCDTKAQLQISFGKETYNISTGDWVGGTLQGGGCKSNIIGRQTFGEGQWLVGDVFLKNVYAVFDGDNSKIGLGVKDPNAESQESSSSSSASPTASSGTLSPSSGTGQSSSPADADASSSASKTAEPTSTPSTAADPLLPAGASATASPDASSTPTSLSEASASKSAPQNGNISPNAAASLAVLPSALLLVLLSTALLLW